MKLVYNTVIKHNVGKVWDLLADLQNRGLWVHGLSVEPHSINSYIFSVKKRFKSNSYRTVLVDKKEHRKISFCMMGNNLKITKTYFLSNNGIETYIKHYTKIEANTWFKKLINYPLYFFNFRKRLKLEFEAMEKHLLENA